MRASPQDPAVRGVTQPEQRRFPIGVLALGYFLAYTAYVVVTKFASLSLPGGDGLDSSIQLIAGLLAGVLATLPLLIVFVHRQIPPERRWPGIKPEHVVAGLATAVIVVTTTVAFSFSQVSVLFALLLMRGGVLILSRILDLIFRRPVGGYSLLALCLSLGAVTIALSDAGTQPLPAAAAANLGAYLLAYAVRLGAMTRIAKRGRQGERGTFFVREQAVALVALAVISALALLMYPSLAADGGPNQLDRFRPGLLTTLVGVCYSVALAFGSLIYLDWRPNTFAVALNRGCSLISGVVASLILMAAIGTPLPSATVFASAAIVLCALFLLSKDRAPDPR